MTIHAYYDGGTDQILGFFDTEMHDTIPTPNITIDQSAYDAAIALQEGGAILYRSGSSIVDGSSAPALADYKVQKKREVDADAASRIRAAGVNIPTEILWIYFEKGREADAAALSGDANMTAAEYPLLAAEVRADGDTVNHANMSAKGTAIRTAYTADAEAVDLIEQARLEGHIAIDAAASNAAVDTAVAAIAWPV